MSTEAPRSRVVVALAGKPAEVRERLRALVAAEPVGCPHAGVRVRHACGVCGGSFCTLCLAAHAADHASNGRDE